MSQVSWTNAFMLHLRVAAARSWVLQAAGAGVAEHVAAHRRAVSLLKSRGMVAEVSDHARLHC